MVLFTHRLACAVSKAIDVMHKSLKQTQPQTKPIFKYQNTNYFWHSEGQRSLSIRLLWCVTLLSCLYFLGHGVRRGCNNERKEWHSIGLWKHQVQDYTY